jgi:hypothetical protein
MSMVTGKNVGGTAYQSIPRLRSNIELKDCSLNWIPVDGYRNFYYLNLPNSSIQLTVSLPGTDTEIWCLGKILKLFQNST